MIRAALLAPILLRVVCVRVVGEDDDVEDLDFEYDFEDTSDSLTGPLSHEVFVEGTGAFDCSSYGLTNKCVFVQDRHHLPRFHRRASAEVRYREAPLYGSNLLGSLGEFHSGITLVIDVHGNGTYQERSLELWAQHGPESSLLPSNITEAGPQWIESKSIVVYTHGIEAYWDDRPSSAVLATLDGHSLNKFFDLIHRYATDPSKSHYQLWSWWSHKDMPARQRRPDSWLRRNLGDNICDSLSEAAIWAIGLSGGRFATRRPLIQRNYAVLISQTAPTVVRWGENVSETEGKPDDAIRRFYEEAAEWMGASGMNQFVEVVRKLHTVKTAHKPVFVRSLVHGPQAYLRIFPEAVELPYAPMPLPEEWFSSCDRDVAGISGTWIECSPLAPCAPWSGAMCQHGGCMCRPGQCAWEGKVGSYCL